MCLQATEKQKSDLLVYLRQGALDHIIMDVPVPVAEDEPIGGPLGGLNLPQGVSASIIPISMPARGTGRVGT